MTSVRVWAVLFGIVAATMLFVLIGSVLIDSDRCTDRVSGLCIIKPGVENAY